nr:exocyst complex component EXO70B1-like [Coffea arabica]
MAAQRSMGSLKEPDLKGKRVFVRVDLDVPLDDNFNITDDARIRAAVPTINYLIAYGAKVILASHLGCPKGVTPKYSLKPLVPRLSELLGVEVKMANDCIGEEVEKLVASLPEGGVLLLENVRFYKEEDKNDPEFAKKLASLADLYVNDVSGTAHRAHASTEGVAKYLKPVVSGFLMQKELDYLVGAVANPKKPFAAILGGSKFSTKISVIESLLDKVDILLLGGGMIFTFYKAQGHSVGSSLVEEDMLDLALSFIEKAKAKGVSLLLPTDVVVADKFAADANSKVVAASRIPDGWMGLDIGPDAIKSFIEALDTTKTIIWNGPMGVFEFDKFATGTEAIAKKLAELSGNGVTTIIGGGDYVAAMEKAGFADKMSHISTGGEGRRRKEIEEDERQRRKKGEMAVTTCSTDGEQKVLAAAQHILKSLNSSANINTDDMILLFSSIDARFANLSNIMQTSSASAAAAAASPSSTSSPSVVAGGSGGAGGWDDNMSSFSPNSQADLQLEAAEELIHRWDSNSDEFVIDAYFQAVDYVIQLMEDLALESVELERVENALQLAMSRLEEEFRHTLIQNTVPLDVERIDEFLIRLTSDSSSTPADGVTQIPDLESSSSGVCSFADHGDNDGDGNDNEGDGDGIVYCRYNRHVTEGSVGSDELFHDLVNPDAILDLKGIADRMIRAGYEKECCQVYSSVRRDVLDECMSILGVEKLSIEDVQRIEWKSLDEKMKKWIHALKIVVRILLTAEKCLCEEIFSGLDVIEDVCFIEATKGCVMQLLNFGEAVAIGRRSSEKLFRILDMYDALKDVLPDLKKLCSDKEAGDMVYSEAQGVVDGLGEAAIGTFVEFQNAVQNESSRRPIQNGEIHPLTRYVMNYVKLLVDYSDTLNALLEAECEDAKEAEAKDAKVVNDGEKLEAKNMSPIGLRLLSLILSLELNLDEKSSMYEEEGLKFVFLMNNILYIVQKVKDSDLAKYLGDDWIRKRRGQIRKHATSYLRASWSKVLSCLKDEGIGGSSSNASKVLLKERFKNFNACFEDIYRIQTAWKVPDLQLRDELKISISEKLIPAYRSFMGRFGSHLESGKHAGKYIKYTSEDLENYLSHLFEGVPLILHHMRRKST